MLSLGGRQEGEKLSSLPSSTFGSHQGLLQMTEVRMEEAARVKSTCSLLGRIRVSFLVLFLDRTHTGYVTGHTLMLVKRYIIYRHSPAGSISNWNRMPCHFFCFYPPYTANLLIVSYRHGALDDDCGLRTLLLHVELDRVPIDDAQLYSH